MLIEAHCHLTGSFQEDKDIAGILSRARLAGVVGLIAVGTDLNDSEDLVAQTAGAENIRLSLGVHPHEASKWSPGTEHGIRKLLGSPQVLFVGETGLDWHYDFCTKEQQETAFRAQIQLAVELHKPLMIHSRSAPESTLQILYEEGASRVGGIIHCFTEDISFAKRAVEMGFYISFSGILTFPKKNEAIKEAALWIPEDRLLVETDAPFLAPAHHRGKRNEPAYLVYTAKCLAELRGWDLERVHAATVGNLETLSGWRLH
jgi:TatD DNase family protein